MIGVVLHESADHRPDGQPRTECRIALVSDPAQEAVGLEGVDGALEFFLRRGEVLLRRFPRDLSAAGRRLGPR